MTCTRPSRSAPPVKLNYDEEAFKLSKLKAGERGYDSRKGKLDKLAEKVAAHDKLVEAARAEIAKVDARIDAMRAKYAADPEFQKHEALLDNGIGPCAPDLSGGPHAAQPDAVYLPGSVFLPEPPYDRR